MRVRPATADDLGAICAIYDHEVAHATSTLDTEPWSVTGKGREVLATASEHLPLLLVEDDLGNVLGWGRLLAWSPKRGYARTAEISIFVHHDARRRGVGRLLLHTLLAHARTRGLGVLVGRIESSNAASLALFADAGFETVGVMREVGEKFGRLLDIVVVQCRLDARPGAASDPPAGSAGSR